MHYIPCTVEQEKEILETIGVKDFDELVNIIPKHLRLNSELNIDSAISEFECEALASELANKNTASHQALCFLGGGVYDHYVPKAVDAIANRSEFYTAYTPYQAEVSQGTLQYLYEFQTMICELSGMDVANASLYDGASAVAEACSLAISATCRKKIALSKTLNPKYAEVVETYLQNRDIEIIYIEEKNHITNTQSISSQLGEIAAVVLQSPNYYGLIENWADAKSIIGDEKTLLVAVSDPVSLSILKSPGECGADIYVGEGQSLGNYMSLGGPFVGLMAVKKQYVRRMPGRIIGRTIDKNNQEGFVLTLQTREQHIRRENATSNICTNQGLIALRATIYMSIMGKKGLPQLAELSYKKAQYTAKEIDKLDKFQVPSFSFAKEFIVKTESSAKSIIEKALNENYLIDALENDESDSYIQICVTEKRSKKEIDSLISFLKTI